MSLERTSFHKKLLVLLVVLFALHPAVVHAQTLADEADLNLAMQVAPNPVVSGETVVLTFQATNPLAQTIPFPEIVITLPPRSHFLPEGSDTHCQVTESGVGSLPGYSRVTCAFDELHGLVGSLPDPLIFSIQVAIHPFIPSGTILPISAQLTSSLPDPNMENNTAQASLRVNTPGTYKSFLPMALYTLLPGQPVPGVIYVDINATGTHNGTSWENAFTDLRSAINSAHPTVSAPVQIWVAGGEYHPSVNDRSVSFVLKNNVSIYGGFSGYETRLEDRQIHNVSTSVLSGELGSSSNFDNAYHVITGTNLDQTAVLNGFVIRDGAANHTGLYGRGGGMYLSNSSPLLQELVFQNNEAAEGGGGLYIENGSPNVNLLRFTNNHTSGLGGGLLLSNGRFDLTTLIFRENSANFGGAVASQAGASVSLINVLMWGNTASAGAALYADTGSVTLTNVSLNSNVTLSPYSGGVHIKDADLAIHNSILWGNTSSTTALQELAREGLGSQQIDYSIIEGMLDNIDLDIRGESDPLFIDPANGNLSISTNSPAVDRGNEDFLPANIHYDLNLNPRSSGARVDQGALETTNHVPVLTPFTERLPEIIEGVSSANNPGYLLADLLAGRMTDSDPGTTIGIALVGADTGLGGSWQISINGGLTWIDTGPLSDSLAMVMDISPQTRIRFNPDPGMFGMATLTLRAWDHSDRYPALTKRVITNESGVFQSYSEDRAYLIQPVHGVTDASVTVSAFDLGAIQGKDIPFSIIAHNPDPQGVPGTIITVTLPPYFTFVPAESAAGCVQTAPETPGSIGISTVTCTLSGLLLPGNTSLLIMANLSATAPIREQLTISADLITDHIDPDMSNNHAATTIRVYPGTAVLYLPSIFR